MQRSGVYHLKRVQELVQRDLLVDLSRVGERDETVGAYEDRVIAVVRQEAGDASVTAQRLIGIIGRSTEPNTRLGPLPIVKFARYFPACLRSSFGQHGLSCGC